MISMNDKEPYKDARFDSSCFAYLRGDYDNAVTFLREALDAHAEAVEGTDQRYVAVEFLKRLVSLETELKKDYSDKLHLQTHLFARPQAKPYCIFCGKSRMDGIRLILGSAGGLCESCCAENKELFKEMEDEQKSSKVNEAGIT